MITIDHEQPSDVAAREDAIRHFAMRSEVMAQGVGSPWQFRGTQKDIEWIGFLHYEGVTRDINRDVLLTAYLYMIGSVLVSQYGCEWRVVSLPRRRVALLWHSQFEEELLLWNLAARPIDPAMHDEWPDQVECAIESYSLVRKAIARVRGRENRKIRWATVLGIGRLEEILRLHESE